MTPRRGQGSTRAAEPTPTYAVTLDATNLTNAYKYTYAGSTYRPAEINNYGRTVTLSLRARF